MPNISSTDATIHTAQDLIYTLHNPAIEIPLGKIGNSHKEALISLAEKFRKATPQQYLQGFPLGSILRETLTGEI